ncbi:hypothetical protein [Micromonospora sp. C32]|uniref:hypothetical protein n=1 Tax=unclassified Micromonospora TaxID=2617518 RepID=UPI001B3896BE|nr:hypothetical protein [Micromonospora sp. C32]MBQ1058937.1 hypothetical protein [Micromonospora sp. C32]
MLVDVTVSPDAVSVAGVDLVPVTVSAHLTDDTGVIRASEMANGNMPYVGLRLVGTDRTDGAELSLTAGTPQDGTWSATIHVPSTWNGTWEVHHLVATDAAWNRLDVDPSASADTRLKVTGTHRPAVTMRFTPNPLVGDGPLTVAGRFYYEDTGEGIANQPIFFGTDNLCVEYHSEPNGTTKADGTFSRTYPKGDRYLKCVGIIRPSPSEISPRYIVVAADHPRVKPTVTAKANRTTVRPGTTVTFTGVVKPDDSIDIELQQLQGRTWRKVAAGWAHGDNNAYRIAIVLKTPGTFRYRVVVPNGDPALVGVSEVVTVRVAAPSSEPSPGGGGGGGTVGGGGTGGLPITGPATAPLVAGGTALLVVGAALMLLARRRRPTPTPTPTRR